MVMEEVVVAVHALCRGSGGGRWRGCGRKGGSGGEEVVDEVVEVVGDGGVGGGGDVDCGEYTLCRGGVGMT